MFITYTSDNELIVTTKKREQQTIDEYFTNSDRDMDDYDRNVHNDCCVCIFSRLKVD